MNKVVLKPCDVVIHEDLPELTVDQLPGDGDPPGKDIRDLDLSDLINVSDIQSMMDNFYRIAHIPMSIIDLKGKVLVGVGWQDICTKFHRIHPETFKNCIESDLNITADIPNGEFKLYKCKNGMWDMATPIYIGDRHIGNLFIGQFFFKGEKINYDHFQSLASKYGFDKKEYLEALSKVPELNKEDIESAKLFFLRLADSLSQLSYSNIKLVRSIEETKKAEEMLKENKTRLERSQEIAHLGSWELDVKNDKLTWSDEVYRIFGILPGEFNGTYEAFLDVVHPDDREAVSRAYTESIKKKKKTYEIEHRIVRKNGEIRFVHEKCEHYKDKSGKVILSQGMVHDITERIKADIALKESREKLNIAVEIGNIGVWEWDLITDGMVIDNRMEKMFGLDPGIFKGTYHDFEDLLNEEDIPHFKRTVSNALNEDKPFETVFRIKTRENIEKYINVKAIVEKDNTGGLVKIIGVCFDITEMKRGAEKVLFKLNEELLRSNKALEQFAYVASHDLQEPLRTVSSFTQLLSMKYKDKLDSDAQEYIRFAVEGSERMYEMINDLLTFSRIQTRGVEFREVDMNDVMDQVKKMLSFQMENRKASIICDELPLVSADEIQMVQLLQNLVSNAIKFSDISPEVRISFRSDPLFNIFCVADNGIGIEPQYFDKIFKIFQRLVSKEQYSGTGIGLAICKIIVEGHGGKIWVESEPGKGSKFCFTLPRKRES